MPKYTIYTLSDPKTMMPFYVGSTTNKLNQRLNIHMWSAKNRPHGLVYEYIRAMEFRPLIEPLETQDNISFEEARKLELFWLRQLKAWGFQLLNSSRPFNDSEKRLINIDESDRQFLKDNWRYLALVSEKVKFGIGSKTIQTALKHRACDKITYQRLRGFINAVKELDKSRIVRRYRTQMIRLTSDEIESLKILVKQSKKNYCKVSGLRKITIERALISGCIRHDKYSILNKVFYNQKSQLMKTNEKICATLIAGIILLAYNITLFF